ncbi:MAG: cyclic nucleotide-binding domain-containing protein [Bacteroidales bacterium]|jgi:CRP/FNR family transcriptional regulator|nr:cyclic nucleotide-binding domain-containing protein [Bacteroidales bacterium]
MKVETDDLKQIRFFEKYSDEQLGTIASISTIREFKVKEIIFEQYDELSEVYVLLSGSLSLGISLPKEKRIHLGTITEGQLFSWSAVFEPYISTAWVMAITPARVIAIDAKMLNSIIENDCDFGFKTMSKIAHTISQRLSDTRFQLMNQLYL